MENLEKLLDELIIKLKELQEEINSQRYRGYKFSRDNCPFIPAEFWQSIYPEGDKLEKLYQMEKQLSKRI